MKTTNSNKNIIKQQNTIKVNILKAIPKYYNGVLLVSTFSFAHFSDTSFFTCATIAFSERHLGKEENHDNLGQKTCQQVCQHPASIFGQCLVRKDRNTVIIAMLRRLVQL